MRRCRWLFAAVVLVALSGVPGARADHITASVSATATLGKAVKICDDEGDFCARGRRVIISWQASCGPAAPPDALQNVVGTRTPQKPARVVLKSMSCGGR